MRPSAATTRDSDEFPGEALAGGPRGPHTATAAEVPELRSFGNRSEAGDRGVESPLSHAAGRPVAAQPAAAPRLLPGGWAINVYAPGTTTVPSAGGASTGTVTFTQTTACEPRPHHPPPPRPSGAKIIPMQHLAPVGINRVEKGHFNPTAWDPHFYLSQEHGAGSAFAPCITVELGTVFQSFRAPVFEHLTYRVVVFRYPLDGVVSIAVAPTGERPPPTTAEPFLCGVSIFCDGSMLIYHYLSFAPLGAGSGSQLVSLSWRLTAPHCRGLVFKVRPQRRRSRCGCGSLPGARRPPPRSTECVLPTVVIIVIVVLLDDADHDDADQDDAGHDDAGHHHADQDDAPGHANLCEVL